MQAELQKLRDENLVLAGHTNTSQKIKYLQQVKQDYNTLNIKIAKLEKYNVELKSALAQANGAHPLLRPGNQPCLKCSLLPYTFEGSDLAR